MYTAKTASEIPETWKKVVRKIGGKQIKELTITNDLIESISDYENYRDTRCPTKTNICNAILLKSFDVKFYTYQLNNRKEIFNANIDSIEWITFEEFSPKKYCITMIEYDGVFRMYWAFDIELT